MTSPATRSYFTSSSGRCLEIYPVYDVVLYKIKLFPDFPQGVPAIIYIIDVEFNKAKWIVPTYNTSLFRGYHFYLMIFKLSSNKLSILSNNQLEQINACQVLKNFYHFSFPFTCILTHVCLCPYADFKDAQRQLKSYTHTHPHWHATVSSLFSWTKASQIYINLHHNTPFQSKCPRSCARISHRFR